MCTSPVIPLSLCCLHASLIFLSSINSLFQLTIVNPSKTPVKTFLIKYDLSDMPPSTKTFLRQTTVTTGHQSQHHAHSSHNPSSILRFAIHLRFISHPNPKKRKFYLYRNIRVVFAPRMPDDMESLHISHHTPNNPKYYVYKCKSKSNTSTTTTSGRQQLSRSLPLHLSNSNTEQSLSTSQ